MRLSYTDHRADPEAWARELGISAEAVRLHLDADVIDLHLDSFIWTRVYGYDLRARHGSGLFGGDFLSQADVPRLLEAGVTGATWSITTNPLRTAGGRARAFAANLSRLRRIIASMPERSRTRATCSGIEARAPPGGTPPSSASKAATPSTPPRNRSTCSTPTSSG